VTKVARAKFETRRTSHLSRSTEALPASSAEASASDFQSRRRSSLQQRLFRSARNASRPAQSDDGQTTQREPAAGRARRSKRRPQSQHSVVRDVNEEQSVSSDTSRSSNTVESQSTGSSRHRATLQSRALSTDSTGSQSSALRHAEMSHTTTQEPQNVQPSRDTTATHSTNDGRPASDLHAAAVTRRYRAPDVTMPMPFSSTTGRNVQISDDFKTASRQPGDFCNAYVFTQQPLMPGEELVLRITGTNMDYRGGLTVGLTACDPTKLKGTDLPDDADKLLDRPEYWVVHKNIHSHPKVNDELAFRRTLTG